MNFSPEITDVNRPFWDGLRQQKLMLQFDRATGRAQFYPRPLGLQGNAGVEWREASGRGTIAALTLSHVAPPALASLVPYVLALVQLAEGPRLLARVAAPYAQLRLGQDVEVAWESMGDGPAFPQFKPAG